MNKTQFNQEYNIFIVLTDKTEIMKRLQSFNPNNQAVAFGQRKQHKVTLEDVMYEIKDIKFRLCNIESRLDNIVKLNNLKE